MISNIGWAMGAGAASILSMFLVGIIVGIAFYAVLLIVALIMFAILGLGGMAAGDMMSPKTPWPVWGSARSGCSR